MLAGTNQKPKRTYSKHGLNTLKKAIRVLGGRSIDRRTALGRALEEWRHTLLVDLGGIEQTSTQQRQLVDLAVKTKLILDSIDAWLVVQPSLVNKKKRSLLPVVLQRQQISSNLAQLMTQIGLERRAKQITLSDHLTAKKQATSPPPLSVSTPTPNTTDYHPEPHQTMYTATDEKEHDA